MRHMDESLALPELDSSVAVAETVLGWTSQDRDARQGHVPAPRPKRTVLEVAVPLERYELDDIHSALERAVEMGEQVLRSYYAVSQHAIPVLSLSQLPPAILYAVRAVATAEEHPAWPAREHAGLALNLRSPLHGTERPTLSFEALTGLESGRDFSGDGPFDGMLALRREFMLALRSEARIPAAILCGAAAEALLREILLLMVWEEGREPADAKDLASEPSIAKLVRRHFHERLGGRWSDSQPGIISEWANDIARLRNRVVHVGYRPTRPEVENAREAHERLERFVGDSLVAALDRYPLTALTFLGTNGLDRRNARKRMERRLHAELYPTNVPLTFERWRREVQRQVQKGPWIGDAERAALMLVLYADGREQWWLMDDQTGLCCLAEEPPLPAAQAASINKMRMDLAMVPAREHVSVRVLGRGRSLESEPTWIPVCDAIPLNYISRFPLSLLPPSAAKKPA